jgi:hypothetical protein
MDRSPCASDCQDGIDNDGDGVTDYAGGDAGCAGAGASVEDPGCDDGRDNDGDAAIDADGGGAGAPDAYCNGVASSPNEAAPTVGCGIGPELALLLPLVAGARRLRRRTRH